MVSVSPIGDNPEFHRETNDIALEMESSAEFSYADFVKKNLADIIFAHV